MTAGESRKHEIEQLRHEIAALAIEMRKPPTNHIRAAMVPFALGAASALAIFFTIALWVKLI